MKIALLAAFTALALVISSCDNGNGDDDDNGDWLSQSDFYGTWQSNTIQITITTSMLQITQPNLTTMAITRWEKIKNNFSESAKDFPYGFKIYYTNGSNSIKFMNKDKNLHIDTLGLMGTVYTKQ